MTQPSSFLWYDYETWGIQPRRDGIAQFAAVRTDANLNLIGEPVDLKCKPLPDSVVSPDAALVTGLNPAECDQDGLSEWQFAEQIQTLMAEPGSCVVGYNSLRFDDEFSRHLFYRNLLDPYSREWRNGNSRWDLLDVVRLTHALRPEGINWPKHEDGSPSFKLEQLTAANGIEHGNAHDAVSDVLATIELARLIRRHQPKLFDYALELRTKAAVRRQLKFDTREPHLHVSGRIPAARGCLAVELPLIEHPDRRNEIIVLDLTEDPSWLLDHNADQLRDWLYTATDDLPDGIPRVPLRTLHLNRSPMVAPYAMLDDEVAQRLNVDRDAIKRHSAIVDRWHDLVTLARDVFRDEALVFNARARHFSDSLSAGEEAQWRDQVQLNLTDADWGSSLNWQEAFDRTQEMLQEKPDAEVLLQVKSWLERQRQQWLNETVKAEKNDAAGQPATQTDTSQEQLGLFD